MRSLSCLVGLIMVAMLLVLTPDSSDAEPGVVEWDHWEFVVTPAATQRNPDCVALYGSAHTCVEWCSAYQDGTVVPRGRFCCQED